MKSSFLITGGAGFIGSNMVEYLLDLGHRVVVLDNFATGKKENIESYASHSDFTFIEGDIRDLDTCQTACEGIDYVIHLAALGSVPRSIKDPITTHQVNTTGMLNMMIAARDHHVKTFVYASSSSVYGDEKILPKVEHKIGKPLSPYAISKYIDELYAKNFYELYGLPTIGLRYFNVFGRRQDPSSIYAAVIPLFVKNLLHDEPSIIHGDGMQSRDFTYIDNVLQANLKACFAQKNAYGEAFNVAYGGQVTVNEVYHTLEDLLNKKITPVYGSTRPGDIKHSNADITKAKKLLKYEPSHNFYEGIKLTIDWYKNHLN